MLRFIFLAYTTDWAFATGCADTVDYVDLRYYRCSDYQGYDCTQLVESFWYSQNEEDAVVSNCPDTCGLCPPTPAPPTGPPTPAPPCVDTVGFRDDYSYTCPDWQGLVCTYAVELYGYSQNQEDAIVANCPASCGLCPPTPAPPTPPPTLAPPTTAPTPLPPTPAPTPLPPTPAPPTASPTPWPNCATDEASQYVRPCACGDQLCFSVGEICNIVTNTCEKMTCTESWMGPDYYDDCDVFDYGGLYFGLCFKLGNFYYYYEPWNECPQCGECQLAPCSVTDGSDTSANYPCQCGEKVCKTEGSYRKVACNSKTSTCEPLPCSVSDGSGTSDAYPCQCGLTECAFPSEVCTASQNVCSANYTYLLGSFEEDDWSTDKGTFTGEYFSHWWKIDEFGNEEYTATAYGAAYSTPELEVLARETCNAKSDCLGYKRMQRGDRIRINLLYPDPWDPPEMILNQSSYSVDPASNPFRTYGLYRLRVKSGCDTWKHPHMCETSGCYWSGSACTAEAPSKKESGSKVGKSGSKKRKSGKNAKKQKKRGKSNVQKQNKKKNKNADAVPAPAPNSVTKKRKDKKNN